MHDVPDTSVASAAREVDQFVASAGWDQPPQLFALVSTQELVAKQPDLAEHVDAAAVLTPVAQDQLPADDLADALGQIGWPETVHGCALAQEIVVLPPEAEASLTDASKGDGVDAADADDGERLRQAAANHPSRTEARLVAAVSRDGVKACVLRLRTVGNDGGDDEVIENPDLAPRLLGALEETLR